VGVTLTETEGDGALAVEFRVTVAFADALGLPTVAAVIVTVLVEAILAGAEYKPVVEIVPTVELPPPTPFTAQVICVLPGAEAVNCCV
jgi:hypothetical protein